MDDFIYILVAAFFISLVYAICWGIGAAHYYIRYLKNKELWEKPQPGTYDTREDVLGALYIVFTLLCILLIYYLSDFLSGLGRFLVSLVPI